MAAHSAALTHVLGCGFGRDREIMIIEKSMHPRWLSNSWLIGDQPGGHAVLVDTGAPMEPVLAALQAHRLTLTHVFCTHHHHDHVAHNADYRRRFGCPVCGHRAEADLFGDLDQHLAAGEELISGGLHVRALHIPGHTLGQLGFVINDALVCTGDTLFRGSVGGTRGPGHTTFADLRRSVMDVLMAFPAATRVLPGHTDPTTVADEWENNPFVRLWRGLDAPGTAPCTAFGEPGILELRAVDYDGGTKCQVRFLADGRSDLVPGSRVAD